MKLWVRWSCALAACWAASVWAAAPPSAEDFASPPQIADVVVSPSGKRLALLITGNDGRRRLGVLNLDPIGAPRVVAAYTDADVKSVRWVNDRRLVYEAFTDGAVINDGGAGTFAVDHDGSAPVQLITWSHNPRPDASNIVLRLLPYGWFLHSTVDDDSDDVFVYREVKDQSGDLKEIQLSRLDTRSRKITSLNLSVPEGTRQWLLDKAMQPRMVVAYREGRRKVFWREKPDGEWQQVADFDPLADAGFTPRWVDEDGSVIVSARLGSDTSALYRFDPKGKRIDPQAMVQVAGFDLVSRLETDRSTHRLLGLHTVADRPVSVWFDAAMHKLQQSIDAALPKDRVNRLYCGRCQSTRYFVVRSSSDRQPGEYFLFDRSASSLQRIGLAQPRIDEASQGTRSFHRLAARDGLSLPVYVTHPPGAERSKPLPAVMLVHGGPWVRGADLGWEAEAQFFATRGWRVLEPEYRGSDGYGFRHFRAGWKQWGTSMQDDLVDTLKWAAAQKLIDPAAVCVVGGSYGGYAALMAPIVHPGAFRCAASFAGVTDLELMYDIHWSDFPEDYKQYGMPVLVGDRVKDRDMLAAASPLKRAAELKIPVLLTHGGVDRRVPVEHARQFIDAARKAGVTMETHFYNDEGHGFVMPANRADHYRRLEQFIGKALGAAKTAEAK